jgi:tRNA(Ile)-lysidine synthase
MNFSVGACHVHHGIRGEEAEEDLLFCKEFCNEKNIPFFQKRVDVPSFAKKEGVGLEEGARILRYDALNEVAKEKHYHKIATAHTASDQAETVLFRLIRGSGFAGAKGMQDKRGAIIRPLLPFYTEEITSFLSEKKLLFKVDSTNYDILFSRNRIRGKIPPEMKQINPQTEDALVRFGTLSRWQEEMICDLCDHWQNKEGVFPESGKIPLSSLRPLAKKESSYPLLYEILSRMARKEKIVIDFERFEALLPLINQENKGKLIEICNGFCFSIEKDNFVFFKNDRKPCSIRYQVKLSSGDNRLEDVNAHLNISDKRYGKVENINKNLLIIHAAFDKIEGSLFARNLQIGDKVSIGKMTRSVKKLFSEAKISAKDRPYVPIICDDKGIVWIPFVGLCDRVRVSDTDEIFTMTLKSEALLQLKENREDV